MQPGAVLVDKSQLWGVGQWIWGAWPAPNSSDQFSLKLWDFPGWDSLGINQQIKYFIADELMLEKWQREMLDPQSIPNK